VSGSGSLQLTICFETISVTHLLKSLETKKMPRRYTAGRFSRLPHQILAGWLRYSLLPNRHAARAILRGSILFPTKFRQRAAGMPKIPDDWGWDTQTILR
jgi:hypothetical protein